MVTVRLPGLVVTDHAFAVPLDHAEPDGASLEVFARSVVAPDRAGDDLPWLVFLQGGPGGKADRPHRADGWLGQALKTHRVLLLDQRGTGRSSPVSAATMAGMTPTDMAAHLSLFRADSIVADAELIRARLAGGAPWETLGQSYGGFITMTYLSQAPHGLKACYVTGGLPPLTASADDVYARTYPRTAERNTEYYRRYPEDVAAVRAIADHLDAEHVLLPDGDRFTTGRLRFLGQQFGMGDGFERVHWMLDDAWHGSRLSAAFRYAVMAATGFIESPFYALQEYCYAQGGAATNWAAERVMARFPEFAADATPLLFTGEMMYPWMFHEITALRPFHAAAELLAAAENWPPLYDLDRLAANEVPVAACVYFDDPYVDAGFQLETARTVGNVRAWVTNEYQHDGLRVASERVLGHLMDMVAGRA